MALLAEAFFVSLVPGVSAWAVVCLEVFTCFQKASCTFLTPGIELLLCGFSADFFHFLGVFPMAPL